MRHVEEIATECRPMASPGHAAAQEYLTEQLEALGATVEIQQAVGFAPFPGQVHSVGLTNNVVGYFPGSDSRGQLVLAAHYDSVAIGPGANDDAAGTAVVLELARALAERAEPLQNDLIVLLTDGEEQGLMGAEAFVDSHPLAQAGGVVLNHESRGASGGAMLLRTTSPELVRVLAAAAPNPFADSTIADAFELQPSNTDYVAFVDGGFHAMDFAYVDSSAYYHNALDIPENLDPSSLQHMGDNSLQLSLALADRDLSELDAQEDESPVAYFNAPPGLLLIAPFWLVQALGIAGLVAAIGAVWVARWRKLLTLPRLAIGFAASAVLVVAAVAVAWAYWQLVAFIRPGFAELATQTPYRPHWFYVGMLAAILTVGLIWHRLFAGVLGAIAVALGSIVLIAVLGLGAAMMLPGSAIALVIPGLGAALGALVAALQPGPTGRVLATTIGLLPAGFLLLPAAWVTFEMGLSLAPFAVAPFAAMSVLLVAPLVREVIAGGRIFSGAVAVLTLSSLLITTGVGVLRNPMNTAQPTPIKLTYTLEDDTGEAFWAMPLTPNTAYDPTHRWLSNFIMTEAADPTPGVRREDPRALLGPAEPADLPAPQAQVTSESDDDGVRVVDLKVTSPRGAPILVLKFAHPGEIEQVSVDGRHMDFDAESLEIHGVPVGQAVQVRVHTTGAGPVEFMLADTSDRPRALERLPGYIPPPPEHFLDYVRVSVTTSVTIGD